MTLKPRIGTELARIKSAVRHAGDESLDHGHRYDNLACGEVTSMANSRQSKRFPVAYSKLGMDEIRVFDDGVRLEFSLRGEQGR